MEQIPMTVASRKAYWTKNRLTILGLWLAPLFIVAPILLLSIPAIAKLVVSFVAFLILSVIARIIVVKTSPFFGTLREDFTELLKQEEFVLKDGMIIKSKDVKDAKRFRRISVILAPVLGYSFTSLFESMPDLTGTIFLFTWVFFFQLLTKSYLIAKDSPLNGFPFFRSNRANLNDGSNSRSTSSSFDETYRFTNSYGSYGTTNIASPSHLLNR